MAAELPFQWNLYCTVHIHMLNCFGFQPLMKSRLFRNVVFQPPFPRYSRVPTSGYFQRRPCNPSVKIYAGWLIKSVSTKSRWRKTRNQTWRHMSKWGQCDVIKLLNNLWRSELEGRLSWPLCYLIKLAENTAKTICGVANMGEGSAVPCLMASIW
jgi:hypothetical protein